MKTEKLEKQNLDWVLASTTQTTLISVKQTNKHTGESKMKLDKYLEIT